MRNVASYFSYSTMPTNRFHYSKQYAQRFGTVRIRKIYFYLSTFSIKFHFLLFIKRLWRLVLSINPHFIYRVKTILIINNPFRKYLIKIALFTIKKECSMSRKLMTIVHPIHHYSQSSFFLPITVCLII